jgi:2-polyprenyl-3-methyl-5-hydroxy-6-metoxy-1,4-benzoquinol methylase
MDFPCVSPSLLEADLANLRVINAYLGSYRSVLRGMERSLPGANIREFTLLDVGTGSGDIPVRIVEWARRESMRARIIALDAEPVTVNAAARETKAFPEISVVRGNALAPPLSAGSVDFVLASQFLHHFSEEKIIALLRRWSSIARRAIIISDLVRHPLAYAGIRTLTRLLTRNVMTLTDAPLSVRRSFTIAEWRRLFRSANVGPLQMFRVFPFRVLALLSVEPYR